MAMIYNPETGQYENDDEQPPAIVNPGDPGYRLAPWTLDYDPGPNWNNGIAPGPPSPRYDWNNGSPVDQALTPGHGWVWEGPQTPTWDMTTNQWNRGVWQERKGEGLGYVAGGGPPGGPPGPPGGGGGFGYLTEPFTGTPPAWQQGPIYQAPTYRPPPDFSYEKFQAPTVEGMYADPSYQFREGQGRQALEQSAAGRGLLRTGGTLKDLVNYGQNAASQEYSNIFGRAVDAHNLGLNQALGEYGVNYGVSRDQRDYLFDTSKAEFTPLQRENELMNDREFSNFLAGYDIFEKNRRRAGDYLTWAAEMGAGAV